MANQELTDLQTLTSLANTDLFFVRDVSTGIDKQITASTMTTLFGGGTFLSHTDTPVNYTGAQSNFVKVNAAGTALEFVADPGFLTDITGESLGDLSDVDLTTSPPSTGDHLEFNGTTWVPGAAGGGTFLSHSDTPGVFTGAGSQFVKVNAGATALEFAAIAAGDLPSHTHVEADITDLQAYLLNITGEPIGDLSDVDLIATAPVSGDVLSFNGTDWVPASGMAPGAHASTHISAGTDEIDGDRVDIDFVPANYTRSTAPTEVTLVVELTAHLAGIDTALASAGSTDFLGLSDTPGVYTGAGSQFVRVNAGATALEFVNISSGDLPSHTHVEADITDLQNYSLVGHTHVEADITDLQAYALAVVTLTAGEGLAGGGDLSANRTFDLDIDGLTADGAPDGSSDFIATFDVSAGVHKKVLLNNLPGGAGAGATATQSVVQARSSTAFLNAADSWVTVTFDTTDIENNAADIDHDDTVTSRINISKTGPILIFFAAVVNGTNSSVTEARVLLNGTTMIQGSFQKVAPKANSSAADLDNVFAFVATAGDFIELQFQDVGTAGNQDVDLDANFIFGAVRLTAAANELFTDLTDTPGAYTGAGSFFVKVNSGATALEFIADPGFLTDITGEAFLSLSDTPSVYTGAGSQFVKVNAGATAVEFVADPGFLTNITNEPIGDLSDVTLTIPADGELLRFNGTDWINNTLAEAGVAATTHTHVEADITDLQSYLLNINAENIGDLNDVTLTAVANGELLRFNGTVWINNTLAEAGVAPASHTHVEADITDLAHVISLQDEGVGVTNTPHGTLNFVGSGVSVADAGAGVATITISGGITTFLGHTDTPSVYTGAGSQFVKVNAGATALEFVADPGFLLNITGEPIGDLSDVDLIAQAPVSGDVLSFNGTDWVPASGMAPGAHASTHISAGTDEIDGDRLDIDFVPSNYTRDTSPTEVTLVVELTAHLKGIDTAIAAAGSTDFLGLTDTPANYTGAGSRFVKVNSGATALEFVADPGFLLNITGEPIGDLSDVVLATPLDGELLRFNGTNWINNTLAEAGISAATHTHVEADITDLQAYLLNINSENIGDLSDVVLTTPADGELLRFNGTNWINNTLTEAGIAAASHAATHISGGSDVIDGDRIVIDFSPTNYTQDTSPAQVTLVTELTAHLAGIDNEIVTLGTLPKWDRQQAEATTTVQTTSVTFVDVPGMTLTTKDLGASQSGDYLIHFSATTSHASQKERVEFRLLVDGVEEVFSPVTMNFSDLVVDSGFAYLHSAGLIDGKIIKVQWRQSKTTGSTGSRTATMIDRRLIISGVPSNAVVA